MLFVAEHHYTGKHGQHPDDDVPDPLFPDLDITLVPGSLDDGLNLVRGNPLGMKPLLDL